MPHLGHIDADSTLCQNARTNIKRKIGVKMRPVQILSVLLVQMLTAYAETVASETLIAKIDAAWRQDAPILSPDCKRVAYVSEKNAKAWVVLDGKEQARFEQIPAASLVFSLDSRHLAYIAGTKRKGFIVIDGKKQKAYDNVGTIPVFSPDSKRV